MVVHAPRGASPRRARALVAPITLQLLATLGIGALLYPLAADWFATRGHDDARSGYVLALDEQSPATRDEALLAAREYNSSLQSTALVDPYSGEGTGGIDEMGDAYLAYEEVLRVSGTDVLGEVIYPTLRIGLPLYRGTNEQSISRGVGHLFGSSLPVGGDSTHSVLTSHSGLVHASLFTRLPQARVGDTFQLRVLGEELWYRVDRIETIEPFVTDSLGVVEGEDRVTLFTCTPIGVNSHRLLVSGVRIPAPERDSAADSEGVSAGFPWWALALLGGSGAVGYLVFSPRKVRVPAAASSGADELGGVSDA